MPEKKFLNNYFDDLKELISFKDNDMKKLIDTKKILVETHKNKKTMIFGNGGSAAIASHFSVDLTKNAKIRCVNFNEVRSLDVLL